MVGFSWVAPVRVAALAWGFFSCADTETTRRYLFGVGLVDFRHDLFQRSGLEALREDGGPADDVLACGELLSVTAQHLGLDFVPEGLSFRLGLFDEVFKLPERFNLGLDFNGRHMHSPFCLFEGCPS